MSAAPGSDTKPRAGRGRAVLARAIALGVFVAVAIAVGFLVPIPSTQQLQGALATWGPLAAVVFVLGYAAITLTPAPKNLLSIAAGLVFGFGAGVLLVYLGALLGAAAAFALGRALGREAVERRTGARVAALDALLRRRGVAAVLGVRLIPIIPFTAVNYAAGLTGVRPRDYALGTALGIIPGTAAYVALGAYGLELQWPAWVAIGVLGALTLAGALGAGRLGAARRRSGASTGDGRVITPASAPDAEAR